MFRSTGGQNLALAAAAPSLCMSRARLTDWLGGPVRPGLAVLVETNRLRSTTMPPRAQRADGGARANLQSQRRERLTIAALIRG